MQALRVDMEVARSNNFVQATPVFAILFVLSQCPEWLTTIVGFREQMQSLEQIEGARGEPEFDSSLVLRCHAARKKPIDQLSDLELTTLLDQNIGVKHILPEAVRRLAKNQPDDTEYFEGQLKEAVERKTQQG